MPSSWLTRIFGAHRTANPSRPAHGGSDDAAASVLLISPDPAARALLEALLGERVLRSIERSEEAGVYLTVLAPRIVVQHTPRIDAEAQFVCQVPAMGSATKVVHLLPPGSPHLPCTCPEVMFTLPYSPLALLDELDGVERDTSSDTFAA